MVLDELNATQTYFKDSANIAHIISKCVKYMNKNNIKTCHPFTGYLNYTKILTERDLLPLHINVPLRHYLNFSPHVLLLYCHGIYNNTGVNCFWIINNSKQVLDKLHTFLRQNILIALIFLHCTLVFHMSL